MNSPWLKTPGDGTLRGRSTMTTFVPDDIKNGPDHRNAVFIADTSASMSDHNANLIQNLLRAC